MDAATTISPSSATTGRRALVRRRRGGPARATAIDQAANHDGENDGGHKARSGVSQRSALCQVDVQSVSPYRTTAAAAAESERADDGQLLEEARGGGRPESLSHRTRGAARHSRSPVAPSIPSTTHLRVPPQTRPRISSRPLTAWTIAASFGHVNALELLTGSAGFPTLSPCPSTEVQA